MCIRDSLTDATWQVPARAGVVHDGAAPAAGSFDGAAAEDGRDAEDAARAAGSASGKPSLL